MATETDYPYYKNIRSPGNLGMSDRGTMAVLGKDIKGLMNYVEVLISGKSRASKTGQPLGNKFFKKTSATCTIGEGKGKKTVPRYLYFNNIPTGNVPFISAGMGTTFHDFRGLLPGMIEKLGSIDPSAITQAFFEKGVPECRPLSMEVIDNTNTKTIETNYVALSDIKNMNPCLFPNGQNPITNANCPNKTSDQRNYRAPPRISRSGFTNQTDSEPISNVSVSIIPDDMVVQAYFASIGLLAIYIIHLLYTKKTILSR